MQVSGLRCLGLRKGDERYYTSPVSGIGGLIYGGSQGQQVGESPRVHFLLEGGVVEVLDSLHSGGEGGLDVFEAVVDEEDVGRWGLERGRSAEVDGGLGFGEVEGVGPGAVVEVGEPVESREQAGGHGVADIGKDSGREAGPLEGLGPLEHRWVELAPEVEVGGDQLLNLDGREADSGVAAHLLPVGVAGEVAT